MFFEKQIYFIFGIIIIKKIHMKKDSSIKNFIIILMSFIMDNILNMSFGSNGLIWWFIIFYSNLNQIFFNLLIIYIFYINNSISILSLMLNYLLVNIIL